MGPGYRKAIRDMTDEEFTRDVLNRGPKVGSGDARKRVGGDRKVDGRSVGPEGAKHRRVTC